MYSTFQDTTSALSRTVGNGRQWRSVIFHKSIFNRIRCENIKTNNKPRHPSITKYQWAHTHTHIHTYTFKYLLLNRTGSFTVKSCYTLQCVSWVTRRHVWNNIERWSCLREHCYALAEICVRNVKHGTALQAGRLRVRFPMEAMRFLLAYFFLPHYGPEIETASDTNEYQGFSLGC